MKISVIGLGKLGCPFAVWLAGKGHDVIGVDVIPTTVKLINSGVAPVYEPGLQKLLSSVHEKGLLVATGDAQEAVMVTDLTFVVVPTPSNSEGEFDIKFVRSATEHVALALRRKTSVHRVVITSTVMPGHTDYIASSIESISGLKHGSDFMLYYNPEFIALGSVLHDLENPDFVLIGEKEVVGGSALERLYQELLGENAVIYRTTWINAELAKLALNCFVTMKISFANMLAMMCDSIPGADVDEITGAIGHDSRIGSKYLMGGAPFGGPCFPRDNKAFEKIYIPDSYEIVGLPRTTGHTNRKMINYIKGKIYSHTRRGDTVALFGTAYKPGTAVQEEALAVKLATVSGRGLKVMSYDPCAQHSNTLEECLQQADLIVIAQPLKELAVVDFNDCKAHAIIDVWRILDSDKIPPRVRYIPVGRNTNE